MARTIRSPLLRAERFFSSSNRQAATMMGRAMMKVKSAPAFRFTPTSRAPPMVDPLRENPGHRDRNWKKPI